MTKENGEKRMNLVDKLLKSNATALLERETKQVEIKRLSKKMGEPFIVTIGAIAPDRFTELTATALDKKGNLDYLKSFGANALVVVEGLIEPNLKDKELQAHFNAATPKELAEKLFKGDVGTLSGEIAVLSGFGSEDEEDEEIKN